jgi:hypothetical protein
MRRAEAGDDQDVDLTNEQDVEEWTHLWSITREQLQQVVWKVGAHARAIAAELGSDAAKLEPGAPGDTVSGSRVTKGMPSPTKRRN